MERRWNSLYKRFECSNCLEEWAIQEKHSCKVEEKTKLDLFWESLPSEKKQEYRKRYNLLSDAEWKSTDLFDFAYAIEKAQQKMKYTGEIIDKLNDYFKR
jgi:hypothetical protein